MFDVLPIITNKKEPNRQLYKSLKKD